MQTQQRAALCTSTPFSGDNAWRPRRSSAAAERVGTAGCVRLEGNIRMSKSWARKRRSTHIQVVSACTETKRSKSGSAQNKYLDDCWMPGAHLDKGSSSRGHLSTRRLCRTVLHICSLCKTRILLCLDIHDGGVTERTTAGISNPIVNPSTTDI